MAVALTVPKLGLTMVEGTVTSWLVENGTMVGSGDVIYLLSTDKTETEVEAEGSGILYQMVPAGMTRKPGEVLGWLLEEGEAPPAVAAAPAVSGAARSATPSGAASQTTLTAKAPSMNGGRVVASPNAKRVAAELGVDLTEVVGTGPGGRIISEDVERTVLTGPQHVSDPIPSASADDSLASPLARRLAGRLGLSVGDISGTGPGGRVRIDDVLAAAGQLTAVGTEDPQGVPKQHQPGDDVAISGMRNAIAQRMTASLREMAQLTLIRSVSADALVELRSTLKAEWPAAGLPVPSITDLIVKATAIALRRHPRLNATFGADAIHLHRAMDIGFGVAVDDGLVVPVIRAVDEMPLRYVAEAARALAEKARAGRLTAADVDSPTFTISSMGAMGIDAFTPVVNPPNVAILGVGRVVDGVAWDGDKPVLRRVLTLSLTIDHRANDGAPGAAFLATMEEILAHPLGLLA